MTWSAYLSADTPRTENTLLGLTVRRFATIGGGMSQNAVFWGSGYHGAAGDSVLSLGVVTGTGDFIETGSAAQKMPSPFHGISAPISRVCLSVTAVLWASRPR